MPAFSAGDIVRVPFPYSNRDTIQYRPAMVFSDGELGNGMFLWIAMITSAAHRSRPSDVVIGDPQQLTGLPIPSIVRVLKIANIETSAATTLGRLSADTLQSVRAELRRCLGLGLTS